VQGKAKHPQLRQGKAMFAIGINQLAKEHDSVGMKEDCKGK